MSYRILPEAFETSRLKLSLITSAEVEAVQSIYHRSFEAEWASVNGRPDHDHIRKVIEHRGLPAHGKPESHQLFIIQTKAGGRLIGYLETLGEDALSGFSIGQLVLDPTAQRLGFGKEIVAEVRSLIEGFSHLRVSVNLRNWQGLSFWIALGFTGILDFNGDKQYRSDASANLRLLSPV